MASRRRLARAAGHVLLFASGAGLVYALQAGLYACALVLSLVALWRIAAAFWPGWPRQRQIEAADAASASEIEQRLLTSLLDQTPAPLLTRRADGVIRVGNRAARLLFGVDDRLVSPPRALADALATPTAEPTTLSLETLAGPRAYALSVTDLADPQGAVRLAVLIDIQAELRAAEAASMRELLQVLSHEIMNALTPVASLAATAIDLLADDQPASTLLARDALETLSRRAGGLARFVEAYRALARLPPPELQPTSLASLVDEAVQLFRSRWAAKGVTLQVERPAADIMALLDLDLMVHALMNVLSNAAEAALANPDRPPVVAFTTTTDADKITLTISDSGVGVASTLGEQVFQPFYTTKPEGTGVGLSFARQVALSHGGDLILVPPQTPTGACFVFGIDR